MTKKLKVAVLMGGNSSEREVSLGSGKEVFNNLDKNKYKIETFDVPSDLGKMLMFKPEVAFLALHGKGGEDGQIQGYLETLGIKYTGCGVLASAIGMDKMIFRWIMESFKLPMPKLTNKVPCVVKPVDGGSSVGVMIVKKEMDLIKAINNAKSYSNEVIVEKYLRGIEVTCGVLGNKNPKAMPVVEIRSKNKFFDYEAKYSEGKSEEICPAEIGSSMTRRVQELAVAVFKAVKARGYARVDFIIHNNKPYILEINTLPGMTPNSLLPKEAKAMGMSYPELLDKMIELAKD
jgi:D-alanine-D-alanine ligase